MNIKWTILLLALALVSCTGKEASLPHLILGTALHREDTQSPLHLAAKAGDLTAIKELLARGAEIDMRTPVSRTTPLLAAIQAGQIEAVRLLIEKGSNVNPAIQIGFGSTPLYAACAYGHSEIAFVLLKNGARVDAERADSDIRLLISLLSRKDASSNGTREVDLARELIGRGIDVNVPTRHGYVALHFAVLYKQINMIRLLLENGAKVDIENQYGSTPIAIAQSRGDTEIINVLQGPSATIP